MVRSRGKGGRGSRGRVAGWREEECEEYLKWGGSVGKR